MDDDYRVVTISKREYESLIRESEKLRTLKSMMEKSDFLDKQQIAAILNIEEKENLKDGSTEQFSKEI